MVDISIVLVSYNTKEMTKECLNSVYEKTKDIDFDIWVVDNNSADGTCEMIESEFPNVNLIKNKDNRGFGFANNQAFEKITAKYVFLLNTDTILINNAVKKLFDFMEKSPNAAACGGNLYNSNMQSVHSYGYFPTIKTKLLKTLGVWWLCPFEFKKIHDKGNNETNEFKTVDLIIGADLMLRKSVLDFVGYFDKDFFLYCEESELQFRIKKAGYEIYILPEAKIFHFETQSSTNRVLRRKHRLISEYLFYKKCYGIKKYSPVKLLFMISHLPRLISNYDMILEVWYYILKN